MKIFYLTVLQFRPIKTHAYSYTCMLTQSKIATFSKKELKLTTVSLDIGYTNF